VSLSITAHEGSPSTTAGSMWAGILPASPPDWAACGSASA